MSASDSQTTIAVEYLLLVRHGHRQKANEGGRLAAGLLNKDKPLPQDLKSVDDVELLVGGPTAKALAFWTAEALDVSGLQVSAARCSDALDAQETAEAYLAVLKQQGFTELSSADTDAGLLVKSSPNESFQREALLQPLKNASILPDSQGEGRGKALMLCGHQPHLTHIANAWLGPRLLWRRRPSLPLCEGEAALLRLSPRPALCWAVTKTHQRTLDTLRQKINSKVELAKVFAATSGVILGLILQVRPQEENSDTGWYWSGVGFIFLSLVWMLLAMCAYDKLSMPKMFWSRRSTGSHRLLPDWIRRFTDRIRRLLPGWDMERPPTREHWILFTGMVRMWLGFFVPAFVFLVLGLEFLLLHLLSDKPLVALLTVVALAVSLLWYVVAQPDLGPQD